MAGRGTGTRRPVKDDACNKEGGEGVCSDIVMVSPLVGLSGTRRRFCRNELWWLPRALCSCILVLLCQCSAASPSSDCPHGCRPGQTGSDTAAKRMSAQRHAPGTPAAAAHGGRGLAAYPTCAACRLPPQRQGASKMGTPGHEAERPNDAGSPGARGRTARRTPKNMSPRGGEKKK